MKILVVDDDDIALDMLENALVPVGYEVDTAQNGREALDILTRGQHKLVVSDWEMPEVDGLELCRKVRSGNFAGYIYFILLTGHNSADDIVAGLSAGADDFIGKPFNPEELTVRVRAGVRVLSLETRDLTIFALAKLAESRDPETGAHLERVRQYAYTIAKELSEHPDFQDLIDDRYCRLIYLTSPLHDIGKIGIPDSVLLKPGRFSAPEFEIMKNHTLIGAETLDAALREHPDAEFLRIARDIAASHHERVDGQGYPHGLAGEEIPLAARIVAIADVYDALTTKRVYKGAYNHEVARAIIVEGSGSHFDSRIVDAFLAVEAECIDVCERYKDRELVPA